MTPTPARPVILITAEHGGNRVPAPFVELFEPHAALLASHRGWDPGTRSLARRLAAALDGVLIVATVTRLLVDLNRSSQNPAVFSELTRGLPPDQRAALIEVYHTPHRQAVETRVAAGVAEGRWVLHLGIHSFTPSLNGISRSQDLALLYDPGRAGERALAAQWIQSMAQARPDLRFRRNHPYRGNADGLTTTLRKHFPPEAYLGIEVEVNQSHVRRDGTFREWVPELLAKTLSATLGDSGAVLRPPGH